MRVMGLVPIISSAYGDRAIAVLQILRDFDDFGDTKTAHHIERRARLRVVEDAEAREAATGVGFARGSLTFRFDPARRYWDSLPGCGRSTLRRLPLLIRSDRCIPSIISAASLTLTFRHPRRGSVRFRQL